MKPLYLKIAGLNSFREEQEIDFSCLCECGVFGIFGPTGSGKSTILDAITLALYGNVERAEHNIQGIINQNENKVYVQFKFSVGGKTFTVERVYKRKNEDGVNLQSCRLLEELEDGPRVLAENKGQIDEQIREIIGLTAKDFTKAVVLPQGKFQEFLQLKGKDRRGMLQRLFGLEEYGEILTRKIGVKLKEARSEIDKVISRQNELGDASQEAVKEAQKTLKKEKKSLAEIKEKDREIKNKHEELKQILEWQQELEKALQEEKRILAQEPKIKQEEKRLELALKANSVKPFITIVNNEKSNLDINKNKLKELKARAVQIIKEFENAETSFAEWQNESQTKGEQYKVKLVKLEEAEAVETKRDELSAKREALLSEYNSLKELFQMIEADLKKLEKSRQNLQRTKLALHEKILAKENLVNYQEEAEKQKEAWLAFQDAEKRLLEVKGEYNSKNQQVFQFTQERKALEKKVDSLKSELVKIEEELAKLNEPSLSQAMLNERSEQLTQLINVINILEQKHIELVALEKELIKLKDQGENFQVSLKQKQQSQEKLAKQKESYLDELNLLEESHRSLERINLASILSKELSADKPCPVCGSLNHPQPCSKTEEGEDLAEISQRIEMKKTRIKDLEEQLNTIAQECSVLMVQLENNLANQQINKDKLKVLKEDITQLLSSDVVCYQNYQLSVTNDLEALKSLRDKEKETLKRGQTLLDNYVSKKESLNSSISNFKEKLNKEKFALVSVITKEEALQGELKSLEQKLGSLAAEKEEKNSKFKNIASGSTGEEVLERVTKIKTAIRDLKKMRDEEKDIAANGDKIVEELFKKREEKDKLQQKLDALITEGQACKNQIEDYNKQINLVTEGLRVLEAKKVVEQDLAKIKENLLKANQELEIKKSEQEKINKLVFSTEQEFAQSELRLNKALKDLEKKLIEFNFISQGEAKGAYCTDEEISQLQKVIAGYKEARLIVKENISLYQDKLKGRSLTLEQWQQFLDTMSNINIQLEEKRELVYKLEDRLETLERNNRRWLELEKERKDWQSLIDKMTHLEKLFRGNTFVEFIAEEQLMQVALSASKRLGELTQYRYALEIDSEGGFVVRDDANGGMRRQVSTLSGGETFLTSLALALALSSHIQLRGKYPLEFFFLDEGFGTLDSYLLETVMNSLERLRLDKMTIGIISHVPELKARIARRLLVEPAEKGGKGTRLKMETA